MTVRFVTYNVNFGSSAETVKKDIDLLTPRADIFMFQEAKNVKIGTLMDTNTWTVFQVTNGGPGRQGSAIAVRNSIKSDVLNSGLRFGVDNHGEKMHDRYMLWADLKLTNDQVLRVISLHFPPPRFEYLQPIMAQNFENFANGSPHAVVAGGDWNFPVNKDKWKIRQNTGLRPEGDGVDGFFFDTSVVAFSSLKKFRGLDTHSDHKAVQMIADVDSPGSSVTDWSVYD